MWIKGALNHIKIIALGFALLFVLAACQPNPPLIIGFVATLQGQDGDLGVLSRDAVILAVEQQNEAGGIDGRRIELLVRNCARTRDATIATNMEMINSDVLAVLGHTTSDVATTAADLYTKHRKVMISPTAATTDLTGIDDYFFRVRPDSGHTGSRLGIYAAQKAGIARMAAILDASNREYTLRWFNAFEQAYRRTGGQVIKNVKLSGDNQLNYRKASQKALAEQPEGVVIVTGGMDAALISQHLRKSGFEGPVFLSGWSLTPDLIVNGGGAVEGAFAAQPFDPNYKGEAWLRFKKTFQDRFGYEPGFAAMHGYDAAQLLFAALRLYVEEGIPLKEAILKTGRVDGLQGEVIIDPNGDALHDIWIQTIINGQLVNVG